jgi:glucose/arabinose dehydrogenase
MQSPLWSRVALVAALSALSAGCGGSAPRDASGLQPIGAGLRGPSGLAASAYARGITHVSALAFDGRGRLWATGSGATAHGSDGVYLVPRGGRAKKVVTGPSGPLGLVWIGENLYVSSLGAVTRYSGFTGTRFRSHRTVLAGPVAGGENNNLVRAPDGRLLMGISSTCDHCVSPSRFAATIVSFEPDGTGLRVFAREIRAAYGLAFYPGTGELLATMNQRDDLGAKTPGDWLALVRRGQNWRFPACYGQGGAACHGVPAPIAVLDKHAAAGGLTVLTGQLGGGYLSGAVLVTEWQSGKVLRIPLAKATDGYTGVAHPFLTGIAHPLPVISTSDGAVLVGDWATGRIYRIATR